MEKLILHVIINILKDRKLINASQHGFMENRSHETTLISIWRDYKLDWKTERKLCK